MSKYTVHQIKIDFHVTEQICRFVYVYIIEGESLYLIDSGVVCLDVRSRSLPI